MTDKPRKGDKVRCRIDAEYVRSSINHNVDDHVVVTGSGDMYTLPYEAEIEILERADDPARDPVGTVRSGGVNGYGRYVKVRPNTWVIVSPLEGVPHTYHDSELDRCPVFGAVPGTPAAEAAKEPLAEWERKLLASGDPVEITAESPEPDRSRVYVDRTGIKWARIGGGWRYLIRNRQEWNGTPFNWDEIRFGGRVRPDFPWHLSDGE